MTKAKKGATESPATPAPQASPRKKGPGTAGGDPTTPMDTMSQCVALCQEQRWREAVLLLRKLRHRAKQDGNAELFGSLGGAMIKIEYSLRRQMAAALVSAAGNLLGKEFLLDVGK